MGSFYPRLFPALRSLAIITGGFAGLDNIINVRDFGALGDNSNDDGAAIQSAFDAAFGTAGSPHGDATKDQNKAVYFPAGTYLTSQELVLSQVRGCTIFGDGQQQSIIKYTGPAAGALGVRPWLLCCQTVTYSHFDGITFDANNLANSAVGLMNYAALANDGTGNTWFDCGFAGGSNYASFQGGPHGSNNLASEQLFVACTITRGGSGVYISGNNALNYVFISCRFVANGLALNCDAGAFNAIIACSFSGNDPASPSIYVKQQNCPVVVGGNFADPHCCIIGPVWIAGAYHSGGGNFWQSNHSTLSIDNSLRNLIAEGCYAPSSVIRGGGTIYLRGNTFGSGSYLTNYTGGTPSGTPKENQ